MASKKIHSINLRGILDMDTMEITETTKDSEYVYDFLKILQEFNGKQVSVQIKEEQDLPIKEE